MERFLTILALDNNDFLYLDVQKDSLAVGNRVSMMEWRANQNKSLVFMQYISFQDAYILVSDSNKLALFEKKMKELKYSNHTKIDFHLQFSEIIEPAKPIKDLEKFVAMYSLTENEYIYFNSISYQFFICDRREMMQWKENSAFELKKINYINIDDARILAQSVNKLELFNNKLIEVMNGKHIIENSSNDFKTLNEKKEILEETHDVLQKLVAIYMKLDVNNHPQIHKNLEKTIRDANYIYEQKKHEMNQLIKEEKQKAQELCLLESLAQQNSLTDILRKEFDPGYSLD